MGLTVLVLGIFVQRGPFDFVGSRSHQAGQAAQAMQRAPRDQAESLGCLLAIAEAGCKKYENDSNLEYEIYSKKYIQQGQINSRPPGHDCMYHPPFPLFGVTCRLEQFLLLLLLVVLARSKDHAYRRRRYRPYK